MLRTQQPLIFIALFITGILGAFGPSAAAVRIAGQVQAGGGPLANATVTLWGASAGEPRQLGQARTNGDGRFEIGNQENIGPDVILYLTTKGGEAAVNKGSGDNPAAAMLSVLGNAPPANVVVNEMTTVASVLTLNQFINGASIRGHALGLKIAAGNVPSFVDLQTGGWGATIQDPLNGSQNSNNGQFRHTGRRALRLHHACYGGCLQYVVRSRNRSGRKAGDRYAQRGGIHCALPLVPTGAPL